MLFKKIILSLFLFTAFCGYSQTDNGDKMFIKLSQVKNNVYMLQAKGGNIGLYFGRDGIFMIDDQFAEGLKDIETEIRKKSKKPVQFLVNTHFHADHTGGNPAIAETGTLIFAQENVRTRLQEMIDNSKTKVSEKMLPIITFSEDLTFYFENEKIFVFHVHNAHTDGDAMIYFTNSNVIHTGDVFFNGKYPFIDLENGGSVQGCIDALNKLANVINEDTQIIPGHGDVGNMEDLKYTINMLTNTYKRVWSKYLAKNTEDEVAKMTDLTAEYDAKEYGNGFITTEAFLRTIYKDIAQLKEGKESNNEKNRKAAEKIEQIKKQRAAKGKQ